MKQRIIALLGAFFSLFPFVSKSADNEETSIYILTGENLETVYPTVFGEYEIPDTLKKLMQFSEKWDDDFFSEGFVLKAELIKRPDSGQWSLDDEYFERLLIFARADGTGSSYAFWVSERGISLENAPIILIGSEGDICIVAKNIKGLLKILTLDVEPVAFDDRCNFGRLLEVYEASAYAPQFKRWLLDAFNIQPVKTQIDKHGEYEDSDEVNAIIKEANDLYQKPFETWMNSLNAQYPITFSFNKDK